MEKIIITRTQSKVCGNCISAVTSRTHALLYKQFKCEKDMQWTNYDNTCKHHAFESMLIDNPTIKSTEIPKWEDIVNVQNTENQVA